MKKIALIMLICFGTKSFATVDSNTNVFIPVQHIQTGEYFVQLAPIIGCYGLAKGPQLDQLTREYNVNNLGCGTVHTENINALACASVVSAEEAADFSTFKKITLNISGCTDKNNNEFIQAIKKAVRLNFATRNVPHPKLILIKGTDGKGLM